MFVIFDFDGTLCKIDHRLHYIKNKPKNWQQFYKECVNDVPNWSLINTLKCFQNSDFNVEIWTGRSDEVRAESEWWLEQHGIPGDLLTRMRPQGNYLPDVQLKQQWLSEAPQKPAMVYEDRQRVVDMWRGNGIVCAQVDEWQE